jgi:hypothetical protein
MLRRVCEDLNCRDIVVKCTDVLLDEANSNNSAQERIHYDSCCGNFISFLVHIVTSGKKYVEAGSFLSFRKVVFEAKVSYV